jgi:hypothetical protein
MLTAESEKRLRNENQLSGFQHKKGAIIFGAMPKDLRAGIPIAYMVVSGVEEREIDGFIEIENESGETERVKTKKAIQLDKHTWAFGVTSGVQPAVDERGLHGSGYEILISDGDTITVPRDSLITAEMYDEIRYKPTLLMVYRNDEPVMVVLYTWDSLYLPCPMLKEHVRDILDESMLKFIESQHGYEVVDNELTVSVVDANKNVHKFGPMTCSLFKNSDCRGCLSRLLNFNDSGWNSMRNLAKQLTGRGTMYADGNFVVRHHVSRELFIRFIEVEQWARIRGGKYHYHLLEALLAFQDEYDVGLPEYQLEKLTEIIKEKTKEEYAEIKKNGDKTEVAEYKELKKQITASLKKLKSYDEVGAEGEEEVNVEE